VGEVWSTTHNICAGSRVTTYETKMDTAPSAIDCQRHRGSTAGRETLSLPIFHWIMNTTLNILRSFGFFLLCPAPNRRGIKRCFRLTSV